MGLGAGGCVVDSLNLEISSGTILVKDLPNRRWFYIKHGLEVARQVST